MFYGCVADAEYPRKGRADISKAVEKAARRELEDLEQQDLAALRVGVLSREMPPRWEFAGVSLIFPVETAKGLELSVPAWNPTWQRGVEKVPEWIPRELARALVPSHGGAAAVVDRDDVLRVGDLARTSAKRALEEAVRIGVKRGMKKREMDEWARGFRAVDFGTIHGEMDTSANYDWDDELLCAEGWASLLASVAKAAPQAAAVRADMVVEGVGFRADVFAMDRRRLVEIIERGKPEDVEALRGAGVERHLEVFKGRQERGPGGVEFAAWTALPSAHKGNLDPQEDWVAIEYLFRVCDWKPESFGNGVGQRLVLEARELEKSVRAVKRVLDGDLDDAVLMVMAHDFIGEDVHEMMEVYFGDNRGPACERLKRFLRVGRMAQGKGKRLLILMEKMR